MYLMSDNQASTHPSYVVTDMLMTICLWISKSFLDLPVEFWLPYPMTTQFFKVGILSNLKC
jgi:hypothetical protein